MPHGAGPALGFLAPAALALTVVGAVPAAEADGALERLAIEAGEQPPLIRIGFDDGPKVLISDRRPFRIVDPATGEVVWRPEFDGEVAVLPEGEGVGAVGSVFRIQAGAYSTEAAARTERDRLAARYGVAAVVRYVPDRGSWRVRVGEADDRDALAGLLERMRGDGLSGLWIAEEPREIVSNLTLRLVDTRTYETFESGIGRIAVLPGRRSAAEVEGKPYRGVVEVRVTPFGTVRAVNWVGLEDYLLGVVPAELGPEVWPQLEALKAQAVAARTYAWRNLGQFADEGFDLCASPRCQVYEGRSAEHPISDRAVRATRSEILVWDGSPINAMFTATCGGHTEDGREIFPEEDAPYLRGVPCRAEGDALRSQRSTLAGRSLVPVRDETGVDVTRDRALLAAAGILDSDEDAAWLGGPLTAADLAEWTRRMAVAAGVAAGGSGEPRTDTLASAAVSLLDGVGWTPRAEVLLDASDLPAVLRDPDAVDLPEAARRAVAYLASLGALTPSPDGAFGLNRRPSRARLLPALARVGETYRALGLREATVAAVRDRSLRLVQGKGSLEIRLDNEPYLFGHAGGRTTPRARLELWPGDRIRFRAGSRGRVDFLEVLPPVKGVSDDRSASLYSWDVRRTRRELEAAVNRRVDIGTLRDLRVLRRGVSGRIVELEVVGSRGSTVIRGFDIRRLLALRESLVVFEIQRDRSGQVEAVVFAGKGWGHGIGLCQVGAYGMALRGAGYREILAHYYRGATLEEMPKP